MPGGEDSYDLIRTKDERSNSKSDTFSINPKRLGTTQNQVQQIALQTLSGDLANGNAVDSLTGRGLEFSSGALRTTDPVGTLGQVVTGGSELADDVTILEFDDKFTGLTIADFHAVIQLDTPYTDLSVLFGSPVTAGATLDVGDVTDGNTTVYDASTDTVGDGTTDANHSSVDTGDTITETLAYDYSGQYPQFPNQPERGALTNWDSHPDAANPVITTSDVTDLSNVTDVWDPIIVSEGTETMHMFFEVSHDDDGDSTTEAYIAHATSDDGIDWTYDQVVIDSVSSIAHPYIINHEGTWYMFPKANYNNSAFEVWQATNFPAEWSKLKEMTLGAGDKAFDPQVFKFDGQWWTVAGGSGGVSYYSADDNTPLSDSWTLQHADVYGESRCLGRPIVTDNYVCVHYLTTLHSSNDAVRAYQVTDLSKSSFSQHELQFSPVVGPVRGSSAWNSGKMHHFAPHTVNGHETPIAAVDGENPSGEFSIGIYRPSTSSQSATRTEVGTSSDLTGVSANTWTTLPLDEIEQDHTFQYDTSSYEYVAPSDGHYEVRGTASVSVGSSRTYQYQVRVYNVTQSARIGSISYASYPGVDKRDTLPFQKVGQVNEGDNIRVDVYHDSSSTESFYVFDDVIFERVR